MCLRPSVCLCVAHVCTRLSVVCACVYDSVCVCVHVKVYGLSVFAHMCACVCGGELPPAST